MHRLLYASCLREWKEIVPVETEDVLEEEVNPEVSRQACDAVKNTTNGKNDMKTRHILILYTTMEMNRN